MRLDERLLPVHRDDGSGARHHHLQSLLLIIDRHFGVS